MIVENLHLSKSIGASCALREVPWGSLGGVSGASRGSLRGLLGASGCLLGASGWLLAVPWGLLGGLWGPLGCLWVADGRILFHCKYTHIHTCMLASVSSIHTCMHACIHIYIHVDMDTYMDTSVEFNVFPCRNTCRDTQRKECVTEAAG